MVFSKVILLASLCLLLEISGHGYMLSPPGRASMWRVGWSTPRDYGDNQLYCGGFYVSMFTEIFLYTNSNF